MDCFDWHWFLRKHEYSNILSIFNIIVKLPNNNNTFFNNNNDQNANSSISLQLLMLLFLFVILNIPMIVH